MITCLKRAQYLPILAFLGSVLICGFLIVRQSPKLPQSVLHVGELSTECMVSGNSDCVYDYIEDRERQALGLTRSSLRELLQQYVLPAYGKQTEGTPKEETTPLDDQRQIGVTWIWPSPTRGSVQFQSIAVKTSSGVRTICTTQWMIFHAMEAKYRKSVGEIPLLVYLEGIQHDGAWLTQLGIRGIYDTKQEKVVDWATLVDQYQREAIKAGWLKKS